MKKILVIAVDGPAGSGKSSVSKQVAQRIGLKYVDSGALYRSITWYFLEKYGSVSRDMDFKKDLDDIVIVQEFRRDGTSNTSLNGRNVSELIRNEEITRNIGIISDSRDVRVFVNVLLRKWSENDSLIMDGRDIGTVVFPGADLKIYLDASAEIRASRRVKEYLEMGKNVDEIEIKNQIILRDEQDKKRPFGALRQADDAKYIDTSSMNQAEVVESICSMIPALPDYSIK
jgi:cytidylate kinase